MANVFSFLLLDIVSDIMTQNYRHDQISCANNDPISHNNLESEEGHYSDIPIYRLNTFSPWERIYSSDSFLNKPKMLMGKEDRVSLVGLLSISVYNTSERG